MIPAGHHPHVASGAIKPAVTGGARGVPLSLRSRARAGLTWSLPGAAESARRTTALASLSSACTGEARFTTARAMGSLPRQRPISRRSTRTVKPGLGAGAWTGPALYWLITSDQRLRARSASRAAREPPQPRRFWISSRDARPSGAPASSCRITSTASASSRTDGRPANALPGPPFSTRPGVRLLPGVRLPLTPLPAPAPAFAEPAGTGAELSAPS